MPKRFKAYSFDNMTGSLNLIDDKSPNDTMPIALLTEWTNKLFTAIQNRPDGTGFFITGRPNNVSSTTLYFNTLPRDSRVQSGYLYLDSTTRNSH
jgi:hypothetical protein